MSHDTAASLEAVCRAAQWRWYLLFRAQGWRTDPDERRRMLAARLAYQEAKLCWCLAAGVSDFALAFPRTYPDDDDDCTAVCG